MPYEELPLSPRLPLLLALADAAHDGEPVLLSVGGLGGALSVRLALHARQPKLKEATPEQKKKGREGGRTRSKAREQE